MPPQALHLDEKAALTAELERHITHRTWGRVHWLSVEEADGRLQVRGVVPSYYVKQLAIQACLDVLGAADAGRLDVHLTVAAGAT